MALAAIRSMGSSIRDSTIGSLARAKASLWTEANAQQQHLTIQLVRNSLYFVLSGMLIRFCGEQLAI
jgi:hypothetical protein